MSSQAITQFAIDSRQKLASQRLTSFQAKLYSQSILKQLGRNGLRSFDVKKY